MDDARRKLRVCLLFIVTVAVILGCIYYVHDVRTQNGGTEGTLVRVCVEERG